MITKKTEEEIRIMREGGKILDFALKEVVRNIKPGITTFELDKIARRILEARGAKPSFLNYQGFPGSACISINEDVVHGVPGGNTIEVGDVVKIDLGSYYKGFHTDKATTYVVGKMDRQIKNLIIGCKSAMNDAIKIVSPGVKVGDIEFEIGKTLKEYNLSPVMSLTGHGIGKEIHEQPSIFCDGEKGTKEVLEEGMVIAIEPMATLGNGRVRTKSDGWTITSKDGSLAAHFEETVAITSGGHEVLTR